MKLSQLEFCALVAALPPVKEPARKLPKPKPGLNATNYTLSLAAALKAENLSHALFNILTCIGRAQAERGHATTAQISMILGVTFNAVHIQIHKSPQLFRITKGSTKSAKRGGGMNHITLTEEAIGLLVSINRRATKYAKDIPHV
jgi:hypothetical protein